MRCTLIRLKPQCLAIERILQWVAWRGVDSSVSVITRSTFASLTVRGAPGRGTASSPSRRLVTNRLRHFPTHCLVNRIFSATAEFVWALAHKRMIRARCAKACAVVGRRAHCSNVPRSSGLKIKAGVGRPVRMSVLLSMQLTSMDQDLFNEFKGHHTSFSDIYLHQKGDCAMDKVNFPYRSDSHLPFLHVVHDSGSWEKHGLDVNYDYEITSEDSHKNVANGTVEFVGGNHLSPYIRRPAGDKWVYLGQTVSLLNHRLVVRADSGINRVSDLKGKKVATKGKHPGLNTWLFIKQAGLLNECDVEKAKGRKFQGEGARDGEAAAAFVPPPADLLSKRAGLKVIDVHSLRR